MEDEPMIAQNSSELCNELYSTIGAHIKRRKLTLAQILGELEILKLKLIDNVLQANEVKKDGS